MYGFKNTLPVALPLERSKNSVDCLEIQILAMLLKWELYGRALETQGCAPLHRLCRHKTINVSPLCGWFNLYSSTKS